MRTGAEMAAVRGRLGGWPFAPRVGHAGQYEFRHGGYPVLLVEERPGAFEPLDGRHNYGRAAWCGPTALAFVPGVGDCLAELHPEGCGQECLCPPESLTPAHLRAAEDAALREWRRVRDLPHANGGAGFSAWYRSERDAAQARDLAHDAAVEARRRIAADRCAAEHEPRRTHLVVVAVLGATAECGQGRAAGLPEHA